MSRRTEPPIGTREPFLYSDSEDDDTFRTANSQDIRGRLANIFDEPEKEEKPIPTQPSQGDIYTTTCFYESANVVKTKVGLVIASNNGVVSAFVYDKAKNVLMFMNLADGDQKLRFDLRELFCEVQRADPAKRELLHFIDASSLRQFAINVAFSTRDDAYTLQDSEKRQIEPGCRVLYDVAEHTKNNFGIVMPLPTKTNQKCRVTKSNERTISSLLVGCRKGSIQLFRIAECVQMVTVRNVKFLDEKSTPEVDSGATPSAPDASAPVAHPRSTGIPGGEGVTLNEEEPSQSNAILGRVAKIGRSILPIPGLPSAQVNPLTTSGSNIVGDCVAKVGQDEQEPAAAGSDPQGSSESTNKTCSSQAEGRNVDLPPPEPKERRRLAVASEVINKEGGNILPTPIPMEDLRDAVHRVFGVEIDRLEMRLEARIQQNLAPIRQEMTQLKSNQEQILAKLDQLLRQGDRHD